MKLMQPIMTTNISEESDFLYEIKYDGFRVRFVWTHGEIRIISRKNIDLTANFPEIVSHCRSLHAKVDDLLPIEIDGELVVLNNKYEANFSLIQKRGRMKSEQKIKEDACKRHATLLAFDILQLKGNSLINKTLLQRKKHLQSLFKKIPNTELFKQIDTYKQNNDVKLKVFDYKAEGIIAKRKTSTYQAGKKHHDWFKLKNWRTIYAFLMAYNPQNDYFNVAVYSGNEIVSIGTCKHGLDQTVFESLKTFFKVNGTKNNGMYTLPPAICVSIHTLDLKENELREPLFVDVLPHMPPDECTMEKIQFDLAMFPNGVDLSNVEKIFWPAERLTKADLLIYIRAIYPYMIPYLKYRALTVIRCPDGIEKESFFQKNLPSYSPDYVNYLEDGDKRIQICNKLESLIWFANHSALEYHVPFQQIDSTFPTEIVFDLDPPAREQFSQAIEVALIIKELLDNLELKTFIKTSGNKGLQIHIPIIKGTMNYGETAIFTEAIAKTVEKVNSTQFTTERLKKNRGNKLYIDYVQHGENRTIVAPYSPRKTKEATVATPLYWEEVCETLHPTQFTIKNVVERVQTMGCPWLNHFELARKQKLSKLLELINN